MDTSFDQSVGADVTADTIEPSLPDWLSTPEPPKPRQSKQSHELAKAQYEAVFHRIMEMIAEGYTLSNALRELPIEIERGKFRRWIDSQPEKRQALEESEKILANVLMDDYIDFTMGLDKDLADIEAVKVKSSNYKWILSILNRRKYGDVKQIDVGGTISITGALDAANRRIAPVIEAEVIDYVDQPRLEE